MNRLVFAAALLAGALIAAPAHAALIFFESTLSGAQEAPDPVDTPATGFGTVLLDDVAMTITVDLSFEDLTTPSNNAHIHVAPPGVPGPVVFPIALGAALGQTSGTVETQVFDITDEQIAVLLNGGYYFNVHSEQFPAGEIRGQILQQVNGVSEPSALLLLAGAGAALFAMRGRRRR